MGLHHSRTKVDKVKRRVFINLLVGVSLSTLVPVPAPVDEYQNFLDRVRARVIKIVRREHCAPVRMEIAPPRVVKGEKFRTVYLWLEGGSRYTWDESWNSVCTTQCQGDK